MPPVRTPAGEARMPEVVSRQIIQKIDALTEATGRITSWCNILLMVVVCLVVLLRYGFNIGSIALQEAATWIHALIFMTATAWTLKHNGHVRVDIFYQRFTQKGQAWVNLLGSLFLLIPVCLFILWISFDYVAQSWAVQERSQDPGGLAAIYLLKSLIPVMACTLFLQGLAECLRNILVLTDKASAKGGQPA
ncbi:TRAP transporter small permease subunit [Endozoicomonadaceae bacterium StTr2]